MCSSDLLLGEGIPDAVVLSAGSRLEELRKRVKDGYGKFDTGAATQLMCRPVAMNSNLHNVLFVPEDGLLYVANASHSKPAADERYVKLDLNALLREIGADQAKGDRGRDAAAIEPKVFRSSDTLQMKVSEEASADAKACLAGLGWETGSFSVNMMDPDDKQRSSGVDRIVRFPSPVPSGDAINDLAAMEWYRATKRGQNVDRAPAIVVVHESGRGMTVGKMVARGLSKQGVHAFMLQLPTYGMRRNPASGKSDGEMLISGLKQGVADARRA